MEELLEVFLPAFLSPPLVSLASAKNTYKKLSSAYQELQKAAPEEIRPFRDDSFYSQMAIAVEAMEEADEWQHFDALATYRLIRDLAACKQELADARAAMKE
jgi:hypothetical protein